MTSWLISWLFPDREPEPEPGRVYIGPCDRVQPEAEDAAQARYERERAPEAGG